MSLSVEAVAVAKKYTDNSIKGISGTLAGKNCTIKSIQKVDGVSTITFEWTADDGTVKTSTMNVVDGKDGVDGLNGKDGKDGVNGYSPVVVENANNTEDNYKLDITTKTTSYTTPNLKGKQGVQGLQGTRGEKGDKGDTGLTGEKGADGVSPIITENSNNSDTIYKLDIVDANGTHTTPNLIGRQGVQGLKGDKGDVGEKGEQGIAGTDGVSPLITTNTANTEDVYKLDITDANGTFTTPNLVGRQGIQGIQGEKGEDGYPFLIYREYSSLDDFNPDHFPEIGLMFMVKAEEGQSNYPIYRYTGMVDTPYSFVTDLATSEGLKGAKGDKGDQGEQGIQGEKGADGITYTPVIGTVTTVASTSDATADVIVDSVAKTATFNFAIPKGANGAIGGKGDKGDTGEKGDAGVNGITYTPTIGTVSTVDSTSEASASVDIDTDNARATFNFSIPRGADGVQGLQGIQGEAGKDGKDGTTYTPSIGEVTTVESNVEASATVSVNTETKEAVFNFAIPKGNKGLDGKDGVQIDDETASDTSVWSSNKTSGKIEELSNNLGEKVDYKVVVEDGTRYVEDIVTQNINTWLPNNNSSIVINLKKKANGANYSNFQLLCNKQDSKNWTCIVIGGISTFWRICYVNEVRYIDEIATMDKVESKHEEATLNTPVDWNTLNTKARYYVPGGTIMTNAPIQQPFGELVVETAGNGSVCRVQKFFSFDGRLYMRRWTGSVWNEWYRFDGTAI